MEQILTSLLQKQGYDYIGIIDDDKKIWGYAKEGKFHFCRENLEEVDRSTFGATDDGGSIDDMMDGIGF